MQELAGRNWRVMVGDVRESLRTLPDNSVHCCVTSPPYWGLRAYGTDPQVWGGDPGCQHDWQEIVIRNENASGGPSDKQQSNSGSRHADYNDRTVKSNSCRKCGAWRGELGSEPTPEMFCANMVEVFEEVRRVLRPDGLCFVNIGDSYNAHPGQRKTTDKVGAKQETNGGSNTIGSRHCGTLKPKDLCGIPWRLAFALQSAGWWLRSEIIWHKRSPMPESVTDRPTKAHEQIFMFAKSANYFFNQEAVKEPCSPSTHQRLSQDVLNQIGSERANGGAKSNGTMKAVVAGSTRKLAEAGSGTKNNGSFDIAMAIMPESRNIRSVWTLSPESFSEAHFATFPSTIPQRAILAGTSEQGCCITCGAPWQRVVEKDRQATRPGTKTKVPGKNSRMFKERDPQHTGEYKADRYALEVGNRDPQRHTTTTRTAGWQPTCDCVLNDPVPCTVLDPFSGSGTSGMVATELGRLYIGCELNRKYAEMSRRRIESWKNRDTVKAVESLPGQRSLFGE